MEALITESVEREIALMSLRASEAVIYQRYGYGMAGEYVEAIIDTARARPLRGAAGGGSFRLLRPDELLTTIPDVYERAAHRRPGIVTRPPSWWERYLRDAIKGGKPSYVVVHTDDDGTIDGYAHYDVAWNEGDLPGGKGEVHDVFGASDAIELALWRYLLDIDLVRTWRADERPVDDIVRAAFADRRAYTTKSVDDEQWVRIVDVDTALGERAYNAAMGSVAIAVHDPLVSANNGTWRVDANGAKRTDDQPDLVVDVSALAACYLGGVGWHTLAAVGDVEVRSAEAIAIADGLFASRPLPFSGSFF
jgi:predicted acetyltransferase